MSQLPAAKAPNKRDSKDPLIGKKLGDYRLTSLLTTGGMARIYQGEDVKIGRMAAIKVLSHDDAEQDPTLTQRFQREARAIGALEHENIITVYQYGEEDGYYFIAMKLVKGLDLAQEQKRLRINKEKLSITRALYILTQVATALDYAHSKGVIHRDVKPSNILLTDDDKAILTDFGLVMRSSVETTMGTAFGTPRYIAPEQATSSSKSVPQSDIYSLAVILYEILAGEPPFTGATPMEIALSHIGEAPPPPRSKNPDIPEAAEREILKALEKEPENRHRSATEFIDAIKRAYNITATTTIPVSNTMASRTMPSGLSSTWTNSSTVKPMPTLPPVGGERPARRSPLLWLVIVLLLIVVAGAFWITSGMNLPVTPVETSSVPVAGAPITLFYNSENLVMLNGGDYTLDTNPLQFVRGQPDDGDDYNGFRITGKIIEAGECIRIALQGNRDPRPSGCANSITKAEFLFDQVNFFWRAETDGGVNAEQFEVRYDNQVVATCPTVTRSSPEDIECRFNWPVTAVAPTLAG